MTEREKNREFVAILADSGYSWNFFTPIQSQTASECFDEILDLLDRFLSITDDFLIPIAVEYPVAVFEKDVDLSTIFSHEATSNQRSVERYTLESNDGLTYGDIVDDIPPAPDGIRFIHDFDIRFRTRITLAGGSEYIDRGSYPRCRSWKSRVLDEQPKSEPIRAKIIVFKNPSSNHYVFEIKITTSTDIWFEETDIGRQNKDRFRSFLDRVQDEFDISETFVDRRRERELLHGGD